MLTCEKAGSVVVKGELLGEGLASGGNGMRSDSETDANVRLNGLLKRRRGGRVTLVYIRMMMSLGQRTPAADILVHGSSTFSEPAGLGCDAILEFVSVLGVLHKGSKLGYVPSLEAARQTEGRQPKNAS